MSEGTMRHFFLGKNESLAQSLVEGAIKSLFAGLVVAALASLLMNSVENSIERSRQRSALSAFKNSTLSETLKEITAKYSNLDCARDLLSVSKGSCKTELSSFMSTVRDRKGLLAALFPEYGFDSFDHLTSSAEALHTIPQGTRADQDKVDAFSKAFTSAVEDVAKKYQ